MARIAGGALAAAVTRAGGLGFIGGGYGDMAWIDEQLAIAGDVPVGVGLITWALTDRSDIVQHVLDRGVRWLWLSFGDPVPYIGLAHAAEAVVACQVQAVDEARRAVAAGADIIVAQGHEAGGHGRNNDGLATLLPAVVAAVTPVPVLAAGGITTAADRRRSVALGALASPSAPASTPATKPSTPTQPKRRSSPHPPGPNTAGYGPRPDDPRLAVRWEEHLDRSLTTHAWLHTHSPTLPNPDPPVIDIAVARQRIGELDGILATAPPDQRRIIDALHTRDLDPAHLHQGLVDAVNTQNARRQWILEHWPHVVEHAELTRISVTHLPLAHWPQPPTPTVLRLHEQLRAITSDTPETATLTELDQQVADASPHATTERDDRQRAAITARIDQIDAVAPHADPEQAAILTQHRQRLLARLTQHDDDTRARRALAILWHLGQRPTELTDAITRRANHLAHHATTTNKPWVHAAIAQWHDTHPHGTTTQLHRLITLIAAYRERAHHTTTDPFGPSPAVELRSEWQQVHDGLHTRPAATITSLLQR